MGTESLLARNTRVNRAIHDREGFLLLDSMTCDPSCKSKIGAKVAKESVRNEKITKKSLEAKSSAYADAPKTDGCTHCHDLGVTSKLKPDPMRTHLRDLCSSSSSTMNLVAHNAETMQGKHEIRPHTKSRRGVARVGATGVMDASVLGERRMSRLGLARPCLGVTCCLWLQDGELELFMLHLGVTSSL
ncbi:hypothetical protein PIB30_098475 [Stylosanthes scabra]|uniref:Uncharacterized protein n=1 Tax=Stylosanthes scabra TaxID=79078 RepID=A0ABU6WXI6_9FABA|nr:hypothetical protein [Stylosanthes scabra]